MIGEKKNGCQGFSPFRNVPPFHTRFSLSNPRCHVLVTDGCFYGRSMFRVALPLGLKKLEAIFQHRVSPLRTAAIAL
jgi:hypothetical protein